MAKVQGKQDNTKGEYREPHYDKNPDVYTIKELESMSSTPFFDTRVQPYELNAKNPSKSTFRKWNKIPFGKRKSAHPQARVVRGLWGDYPMLDRVWQGNKKKPKLTVRFFAEGDGYMAHILGANRKQDERVRASIIVKPYKYRSLKGWKAYYEIDGEMMTLGYTEYVAWAQSVKLAVSQLLGMPIFYHNGYLWSAHDVYRKIHFTMPYKSRTHSVEPKNILLEWDTSHCNGTQMWAWDYIASEEYNPVHPDVKLASQPNKTGDGFKADRDNSNRNAISNNLI